MMLNGGIPNLFFTFMFEMELIIAEKRVDSTPNVGRLTDKMQINNFYSVLCYNK
jgi:hypothetical protein